MQVKKRSEALVVNEVEDEILVLDESAGRIHLLNATAAFIWRICDTSCLLDIAKALGETYDVEQEAAREDVRRTLATLTTLGLVQEL